MSIVSELERLIQAKADLKTAINAKKSGTIINQLIDDYATALTALTTVVDTADATAVANSLLYGHTAYGANGSKLTGTGAYWQYVTTTANIFYLAGLVGNIELYIPNASLGLGCFASNPNMTLLTLTFNGTMAASSASAFSGCSSLVSIVTNLPMDFTITASIAAIFATCNALVNITIKASTIKVAISFAQSPLLSTSSLLSVANGLNAAAAPKTLTMHATSKTNMNAINVDNASGVAVIGTAMTLTAFITNVKGWTVA